MASAGTKAIGFLHGGMQSGFTDAVAAFRQGLKDIGYEEYQNCTIDFAFAEGHYDKLPALAKGLVDGSLAVKAGKPVDVIAAPGGVTTAKAAEGATSKIAIVFVSGFNPADAQTKLVTALHRPGGNATGIWIQNTEQLKVRLTQFLQYTQSKPVRLLLNPQMELAKNNIEQSQIPGVPLIEVSVDDDLEKKLKDELANMKATNGYALIVDPDAYLTSRRDDITQFARANNVPDCHPWLESAKDALLVYGVSLVQPYRLLGTYVGNILAGADPTTYPVSRITDADFKPVFNKRIARSLGIDVHPELLKEFDRVIE